MENVNTPTPPPPVREVNPEACFERLRSALEYYAPLDEDPYNDVRAAQAASDLRYLENWLPK